MKIVDDIIQPQGAKLKPQEEMLIHFAKACESLQVQMIGSVLLASLTYEANWKTVIVIFFFCYFFITMYFPLKKCLYVIEYLCKRLTSYARYFKYHKDILENLQFNGDHFQIKQMKTVKESILDIFCDQSTPKDISQTSKYIDPLMQRVFFLQFEQFKIFFFS